VCSAFVFKLHATTEQTANCVHGFRIATHFLAACLKLSVASAPDNGTIAKELLAVDGLQMGACRLSSLNTFNNAWNNHRTFSKEYGTHVTPSSLHCLLLEKLFIFPS
jgi:hypothetical protein